MHYSLYREFILRDTRIWNLAVKMNTNSLSSEFGILALLLLIPIPGFVCVCLGYELNK